MPISMRTVIEQALQSPTPDVAALERQLIQTGKHHAPSAEDIQAAVASGETRLVDAVVRATALPDSQRRALATAGLQAWADNPLASRQAVGMVQCLLNQGADASLPGKHGPSALDKAVPMLDRLWKEEGQRKESRTGQAPLPAASSVLMAQCVSAMRLSLGLTVPLDLDRWRQGRASKALPSEPALSGKANRPVGP